MGRVGKKKQHIGGQSRTRDPYTARRDRRRAAADGLYADPNSASTNNAGKDAAEDDESDSGAPDARDPVPSISLPKTREELESSRRIIVVLERASLEIVKKGADYQLLNCDDHAHILRKHRRDPALMRPDITHQSLLALLDSPLNKRGLLQVFIRTEKDALIEVNPKTRIPRTFRRFSGLIVQLLHKLSVRAADSNEKLLRIVKNPVSRHLPAGALKIGTSCKGKLVRLREWVKTLPQEEPVVFFFGAMSHGFIEGDECDEMVSFSEYPLSAACALGKLLHCLEDNWNIV